ncbi:MAG: diguanylate cyclase [Planctomycetes bacterium]|nr:diguanylate cyclase [Planctomycetota bacterium]
MKDAQVQRGKSAAPAWRALLDAARTLQCKATIFVVVLVATVTAATSGYLLESSVGLLRQQHDEELVHLAGMVAKSCGTAAAGRDPAALQAILRQAVRETPLAYLNFTDPEGRELAAAWDPVASVVERTILATADRPAVPGRPAFHAATSTSPAFLDLVYPVTVRADAPTGAIAEAVPADGATGPAPAVRLVGYLRAAALASAWQQALASRLDLLIGVGTIALIVAIPLGSLVIRRIVLPLGELEAVMLRFSHGDLTARSKLVRRDEIGRLSLAFNRMADQHQQTHERIVRLNADLEGRVAQRTRQLRELAAREPLTGLYNRRHFNEMLERCFAEAERYEHDLSCIMFDLDNFKGANDTCGHHVGDELLILTAATISSQLRSSDVPARYGGDEFIVLLPQTGLERAQVLAERIVEKFTADVAQHLPQIQSGVSAGIASLRSVRAVSAEALIRAADRCLYQAKAAGKNGIVVTSAETQPAAPTVA